MAQTYAVSNYPPTWNNLPPPFTGGIYTQIGDSLHRIREWRYTDAVGTEEIHAAEEGKQPQLQYREELPPDCPPESAREITEATTRYRLLRNPIPAESDFDSYARQSRIVQVG